MSKYVCSGFGITSGLAVITGVLFGLQHTCNSPAAGVQ